ncbi:MAG: isocitrate/isopropylmalate family dehydrogenase, partial [Candidatus Saccharimonadales bacterium]
LYNVSPLKNKYLEGTDLLIVRELTGGIYFGEKSKTDVAAEDTCRYTRDEIERIARVAFNAARVKVTSVDKANVLATSKLWREVVSDIAADYDMPLDHMLVDNAAMRLVGDSADFDVVLTENMFGDILSDVAGKITGSIGLLPSASLGDPGRPGIFEPVHGSAPDIAGTGSANPVGMFLSASLMLRYDLGKPNEADAIDKAVNKALSTGMRTKDMGGSYSTGELTKAVLKRIS